RLFERRARLRGLPAQLEHGREAYERVPTAVEVVRDVHDRDCLAGEPLGFVRLAAPDENLRLDLSPQRLSRRVVARTELFRPGRPRLGFLEPVELVQREA